MKDRSPRPLLSHIRAEPASRPVFYRLSRRALAGFILFGLLTFLASPGIEPGTHAQAEAHPIYVPLALTASSLPPTHSSPCADAFRTTDGPLDDAILIQSGTLWHMAHQRLSIWVAEAAASRVVLTVFESGLFVVDGDPIRCGVLDPTELDSVKALVADLDARASRGLYDYGLYVSHHDSSHTLFKTARGKRSIVIAGASGLSLVPDDAPYIGEARHVDDAVEELATGLLAKSTELAPVHLTVVYQQLAPGWQSYEYVPAWPCEAPLRDGSIQVLEGTAAHCAVTSVVNTAKRQQGQVVMYPHAAVFRSGDAKVWVGARAVPNVPIVCFDLDLCARFYGPTWLCE